MAAEGFAPKPGGLRRIILMAAMVPLVGALADAAENALQLTMLLTGATDTLASLSSTASSVKNAALLVGLVLLLGAVMARINLRRMRKANSDSGPKIPGLL